MMTNIKIDLTDEQRVNLQQQLTGRRKPITRAELTEFVAGVVKGALECKDTTTQHPVPGTLPQALAVLPPKYAEMYAERSEQWKAGWLRGWNAVGDAMK